MSLLHGVSQITTSHDHYFSISFGTVLKHFQEEKVVCWTRSQFSVRNILADFDGYILDNSFILTCMDSSYYVECIDVSSVMI